jgi:hypothetical protein
MNWRHRRRKGKRKSIKNAKILVKKNKDMVGRGCIKDENGKICVEKDNEMEVWVACHEKLVNEEFE